jgi:hypothetical protein
VRDRPGTNHSYPHKNVSGFSFLVSGSSGY